MKKLLIITAMLLAIGGCTKEISMDDLQNRNEIYYEVNSRTPFTGTAILYYDNGQIRISSMYRDGKHHGRSEFYAENGALEEIQNWKEGKLDGDWEEYYGDDDTLSRRTVWKDGVKQYALRFPEPKNKVEELFEQLEKD